MKDGIKICLVLDIMFGVFSIIAILILYMILKSPIVLLGLIACAPSIIVCYIALSDIDSYGSGLAVVVLMFGNFIAGILMLLTVYSQEQAYKIAAVLKNKNQSQNKEFKNKDVNEENENL